MLTAAWDTHRVLGYPSPAYWTPLASSVPFKMVLGVGFLGELSSFKQRVLLNSRTSLRGLWDVSASFGGAGVHWASPSSPSLFAALHSQWSSSRVCLSCPE